MIHTFYFDSRNLVSTLINNASGRAALSDDVTAGAAVCHSAALSLS